jgi:hypothetical protein
VTSSLLERILRESQGADVLELLAERLSPTDLQSLLLEVCRRRAARITPAALLAAYERGGLARPSATDPVALLDFDRLAFGLASPPFEPIELSPVCPLGTNAAVATVDQNKAVATIRTGEVVSDSTNVLALECAARRRALARDQARLRERVRLCASHRLLRPQPTKGPASFAHFRLFALCTAGRDEGDYRFELDALREQLGFYLRLLDELRATGYALEGVRVTLTELGDLPRTELLGDALIAPLAAQFPQARWGFDPGRSSGRGYYAGLCFGIYAAGRDGVEYFLVDGGFTTWTQQLLSNQKERLLISGIGSERVCSLFRTDSA